MNARRRRERVRALIDSLKWHRTYDRPFEEILEGIYNGSVIIEESQPGDPPVLSDTRGRLLKGSGQREGCLLPLSLFWLSVGVPRSDVDRREAIERMLAHGSDRQRYAYMRSVLR